MSESEAKDFDLNADKLRHIAKALRNPPYLYSTACALALDCENAAAMLDVITEHQAKCDAVKLAFTAIMRSFGMGAMEDRVDDVAVRQFMTELKSLGFDVVAHA